MSFFKFEPESITNIFKDLYNDITKQNPDKSFVPPSDFYETPDAYQIDIALPGMKRDDFKIEVKKGKLFVIGERKRKKQENWKYIHTGTSYGKFTAEFDLYKNADEQSIKASYQDGILTIIFPKIEVPPNEEIHIKVD